MPRRGQRSSQSRTESRRRARLAARGELEEEATLEVETPAQTSATSGGLLGRLFPPAPPLPGMPDPLAGYAVTGRLRPILEPFWILGRQAYVWLGAGLLWAICRLLTDDTAVGVVSSFLGFGALIATGWFGWRRPWLYGMAAAIFGVLLFAAPATQIISQDPEAAAFSLPEIYARVVGSELVQLVFGGLGGWYGGYFRRRIANQPSATRGRSSRRR